MLSEIIDFKFVVKDWPYMRDSARCHSPVGRGQSICDWGSILAFQRRSGDPDTDGRGIVGVVIMQQ